MRIVTVVTVGSDSQVLSTKSGELCHLQLDCGVTQYFFASRVPNFVKVPQATAELSLDYGGGWVSEWFLNGTLAHIKLFSALQWWENDKNVKI